MIFLKYKEESLFPLLIMFLGINIIQKNFLEIYFDNKIIKICFSVDQETKK